MKTHNIQAKLPADRISQASEDRSVPAVFASSDAELEALLPRLDSRKVRNALGDAFEIIDCLPSGLQSTTNSSVAVDYAHGYGIRPMKSRLLICLVLICGLFSAVVADAKTVRIATFNIENGPGAPGSPDYLATKAVIQRIDADIVAFQEILSSSEQNWRALAVDAGYDHVAFGRDGTSMSGNQRLGYFSRFPIISETAITSPPGANEMTRRPLRVVVAVPDAKPLVIWNMHHKASERDAADLAVANRNNQFRRAIEARRIVQDINAYREANPTHDEFVMLGDLNDDIFQTSNQAAEITQSEFDTFLKDLQLMPSIYSLWSDVTFPVRYRAFPDDHYGPAGGGMHRLDLRQQDGTSKGTLGDGTLDYIFVSTALQESLLGAPIGEIYNSQLDATHPGLPKAVPALASSVSGDASDHLPVFTDIEMDDATPSLFVNSFSPGAAAPGAQVTIEGLLFDGATSVRFGGVEAPDFSVVNETQIIATVPEGAWAGPITVSGPNGSASSYDWFLVAALPASAVATTGSSSLTGFAAIQGATSSSQVLAVSAAGLGGPLQVSAPPGFEVSTNGTNYSSSVALSAPPRSDTASNYAGSWTNGSTAGNGFRPWEIFANAGSGQAEAYFGNPTNSDVQGMAPTAFALRASPEGSGASVWALRPLESPLAAGEALSFDWGINWDSNNGSKGFLLASGSATILSVIQYGYPGPVYLWYDNNFVDTGLAYGTQPMRWTFRQVDAQTLNVTATSRGGGTNVIYSTNVPVPGAVSGLWWFAAEMEPNVRRISYYDNLNIAPSAPGGGALSQVNVFVRLAANATPGVVSGLLGISSAGQNLASVNLSGAVTDGAYFSWAQLHGLDPQGNGARGADPDNDGSSNLREFLFGGIPTVAESSLLRHELQPSGLLLTFFAREGGVSYKLMSTGNLSSGTWFEESLEIQNAEDQDGVPDGYKRRQVIVPGSSGNRFFRLQAVESSP